MTAAAHDTLSRRAERHARQRMLVTPEGVDLRVQLASGSDRASAFFIDFVIISLALIATTILAALAGAAVRSFEFMAIVWLLGFFVLRVFYFTLFEMGPRAATPGKRIMGIRVAARDGGRLRAESIFARNAMREVEVFLPLSFLAAQQGDQIDALITLAGFLWSGIFAFFPLFNADRLRPGDIVAGTWVVRAPRRDLEADLAADGERALSKFSFTTAELDAYGVRELHVLERVLRSRDDDTIAAVAERIRTKIARNAEPEENDAEFLDAYYTALRQRLETRLLYGVRRRDKHDKR